MKLSPTVLSLAFLTAACAAAPNAPANDPSGPAAESGPREAKAPGVAPVAAVGARDPRIVALAQPALACKFEDDDFDRECPAVKAWSDNEELFAEGKGNETIFSMLADKDPKVRALAALHGIDDGPAFFADKDHARRVFELANGRADADGTLAYYVSLVPADKLGLGKELVALAKHPSRPFRSALSGVITKSQSPSAVATLRALLDDADTKVREDAISALSTGGITPPVEPVCSMLQEQMQKRQRGALGR